MRKLTLAIMLPTLCHCGDDRVVSDHDAGTDTTVFLPDSSIAAADAAIDSCLGVLQVPALRVKLSCETSKSVELTIISWGPGGFIDALDVVKTCPSVADLTLDPLTTSVVMYMADSFGVSTDCQLMNP